MNTPPFKTLLRQYRNFASAVDSTGLCTREIAAKRTPSQHRLAIQRGLRLIRPGHAVGVEIEFHPRNNDFFRARAAYFEVNSFDLGDWKRDGSVDGVEDCPTEVTLLCSDRFLYPLKTLCRLLNRHGASFSDQTGLHIHLDQRDLFEDRPDFNGNWAFSKMETEGQDRLVRRYRRLAAAYPWLAKMSSEDRRENSEYCDPVPKSFADISYSDFREYQQSSQDYNQEQDTYVSSHYLAINAEGFFSGTRPTFEIRIFDGTADFEKIEMYIHILRALCYYQPKCATAKDFFENHPRCTPEMKAFIKRETEAHQ